MLNKYYGIHGWNFCFIVKGLFQNLGIAYLLQGLQKCHRVYRNVTGFTGMSQGFYRWVTVRGVLRDLTEILQLSARVLSWYFSNTLSFLSHQVSVLFKYIWIIFPLYSFSYLISVPFCISFLLSYQFFLILSTLIF